jgi:hypothetical protein
MIIAIEETEGNVLVMYFYSRDPGKEFFGTFELIIL